MRQKWWNAGPESSDPIRVNRAAVVQRQDLDPAGNREITVYGRAENPVLDDLGRWAPR